MTRGPQAEQSPAESLEQHPSHTAPIRQQVQHRGSGGMGKVTWGLPMALVMERDSLLTSPPDSFSVTGLLPLVKMGSKRVQAKTKSLCFFQSAGDLDAMIWSRAATRRMNHVAGSLSFFLFPGEVRQRERPHTAQGWSRWMDALAFPLRYLRYDAVSHTSCKALRYTPPATSFPLLCTKAVFSMKWFHHSSWIYLLRQQLLSSCFLKITTLSSTFLVPFNPDFLLHYQF